MSRFAAGSMTGDQLIEEFGIQKGSDVGDGFNAASGATDSNQTKENSSLGGGYLTNETYDRLKGDARVKEAYAAVNGQEAADKKFKDGSISINTMDALFDTLTEAPKEQAPAAPQAQAPVVLSDRAAQAVAGTKTYEDVMLPRQGDYTIKNDQSVISDFNNTYALNLARAKAPQTQQPQAPRILDNAEAQATQSQAMNYANNYKKSVGDTLIPTKLDWS